MATSESLKGAEVEEEKEQKKASDIMAERLPGLIEPNLPPDQQPLNDTSNPNPVGHTAQPLHPDRFTPGAAEGEGAAPSADPAPTKPAPTTVPKKPASAPPATAEAKPDTNTLPRRNP